MCVVPTDLQFIDCMNGKFATKPLSLMQIHSIITEESRWQKHKDNDSQLQKQKEESKEE